MPKRIEKLPDEQRARFSEWRDKWIAIGLSTDRADYERCARALRTCYRLAGLPAPRCIVSASSPLVAVLAGPIVNRLLGDSVRDSVGASVDASVRDSVKKNWTSYHGGALWCAFAAYTSFFTEVCGLDLGDKAEHERANRALSETAAWIWMGSQVAVISDRPHTLRRDDGGRLHCETGPAIAWNGWGIHAWHGTRIPAEWIEQRATLDPRTALTWPNIEQRRAAAEIIGWSRVLDELPHRVIDADPDPMIGTLIEVDLPDAPRESFLRVRCPTGRDFALCVSGEGFKTALAAQTSLAQIPEELFKQIGGGRT